jgi:hypothetical protein
MISLGADGRTILAIQGDIKDASAQVLNHLTLQEQALFHAREHTTVMITHRQPHTCGLGVQQHVGGTIHETINK